MSASTPVLPQRLTQLNGPAALAAAIVPAIVVAVILDAVVAAIAHAAGVSHAFTPLQASGYVSLTVLGVLFGAIGWSLVRSHTAHPRRTLTRLVPIVLLVSFIPDIAVGAGRTMTGSSWGGVVALMIMHVLVATVAVAGYATFLPPAEREA